MKKHLQERETINYWDNKNTVAERNLTVSLTDYLNGYIDEGEIVSCTTYSATVELNENQISFYTWNDVRHIKAPCPTEMPSTVDEAILAYKEKARLVKIAVQAHMALKWVMDKDKQ